MRYLILIPLLVFILFETVLVQAQQQYALVICGGCNNNSPSEANCPDSIAWYKTFLTWENLINQQHFKKENVLVLFGEGHDWNDLDPLHDNERYKASIYGLVKITSYPSNTTVLTPLLNKLKYKMNSDDTLSVYFINPNSETGINPASDLILSYGRIKQKDFIERIKQLSLVVNFYWISIKE